MRPGSPPFLRRGRWIPQRSAEFNGGGSAGGGQQIMLEPFATSIIRQHSAATTPVQSRASHRS